MVSLCNSSPQVIASFSLDLHLLLIALKLHQVLKPRHAAEVDDTGRRQPMTQILDAEALAKPCQIVISREVSQIVEGHFRSYPLSATSYHLEALDLKDEVLFLASYSECS